MNDTYTNKHNERATDLYELRQYWLDASDIHSSAFESVEARLNASLYQIADTLPADNAPPGAGQTHAQKEPGKAPDCFIFLAAHLNAPRYETNTLGYDLAYQWLSHPPARANAAEDALSLYPPQDHAALLKRYDEQETLRPVLFRIFRKQMAELPQAMVNTAAISADTSNALKIEALRYAAARPDIGQDIFRTHYVPLLTGKTQFDAGIVEVAIWGGMVRNDPDASRVISSAIANTSQKNERAKLLRLAALTGAAEYLPLLLNAAESDPASGYPLLVLYGQKSVMPELLKALENPRSMEHAATAYTQLTDQLLPRIPRLTVVGEEEADDEEDAPKIPDVKAARAWWDKHQPNWKEDERWLFGKPATTAHLAAMCKKHAGRFGIDLMALLALSQKAPLNIPPEIWRARQQQLLADTMAAPTATQPAQPAKARHA